MPGMQFVKIVVPRPFEAAFDYACEQAPPLGSVVRVPFGRETIAGVVWAYAEKPDIAAEKVKQIVSVSTQPAFSQGFRAYLEWVAEYTLTPLGSVVAMAMPMQKAEGQKIRKAEEERSSMIEYRLSEDQKKAAEKLIAAVKDKKFSVTLLEGVTGSGKTEVYLAAIREVLQRGGQALVMVPEIILTTQLIDRFAKQLGVKPTLWHSGLTPAKRRDHYAAITSGEAKLVLGARSALFLPYPYLELIVVDEEHESGYKQEDGVLYHARDMAVARGHHEAFAVVLASATPSLETLVNVERGKYAKVHLPERHGDAQLPKVELIDMRVEPMDAQHFLSPSLKQALTDHLARQEQALLYLNRRGYAPLTLCRKCGHRMQCPQCSTWLVRHRSAEKLLCHHCGHQMRAPKECPDCHAEESMAACGPGVERIAEEVQEAFPEARTLVLSSDLIATPKMAEEAIKKITQHEVDILIGTQMVAKGHHFPQLTLVGIVDADLGLEGGDLRAAEKTYQLLHQVAGRAGRAEKPGKVMIQTYQSEHPVMQAIKKHDRARLMEIEHSVREEGELPPFGRLASIILSGKSASQVEQFARQLVQHAPQMQGFDVLGPAPAPIYQLRGHYRYRLIVKAGRKKNMQAYIKNWLTHLRAPKQMKLRVDIDPYSFM